jgi:predicted Rossmann fold flavoprotein
MEHADVIIIGGGAAGLMCAIAAGQRDRKVILLEGSNKVGKKILMSGGGHCNFTNLHTEPSRFLSENAHFCKSALSRYTQWDFISLVEKHGIAYHEKALGQLFCDKSSKDIVAMLVSECEAAKVRMLTHCANIEVSGDDAYKVSCSIGSFSCASLVIATGGLSIPKMGASDFGYRLARQYSMRVLDTSAGLVPFTLTGTLHEICNRLSGVSCRATVTVVNTCFTEDILFTHRGLSGPAMLQASSYWSPGEDIEVNLLPDLELVDLLLAAKRSRPKSSLHTLIAEHLPKALVKELRELFWPEQQELVLAEFTDDQLRGIAVKLQSWSIKPAATEGYRTAEVTMGGVDTNELSSKTMESKQHPGLYFIGEVVDVSGHLGGFNFQWAWSSGQAAGQVV